MECYSNDKDELTSKSFRFVVYAAWTRSDDLKVLNLVKTADFWAVGHMFDTVFDPNKLSTTDEGSPPCPGYRRLSWARVFVQHHLQL